MDKPTTVTAAVLVIGDEILSGRTKDRNLGYIAEYLAKVGVDVKEASVVPDVEDEIVAALDALRRVTTMCSRPGASGRPMTTSPPMRSRARSASRSTRIRGRSPPCSNATRRAT